MLDDSKIIELTKTTINNFNTGYISGPMNYKFRTKAFLDVIFLYINSVDVANPDILGTTNKNSFIYEVQDDIRKIKEQVRLDIKDINFLINGSSSLGRFVVKAANRKMLKDNNFAFDLDDCADNAVDFGSGYIEVYKDDKGKLILKSIDPYRLIFNTYNFAKGLKIKRLRRTPRQIIANESYDKVACGKLQEKIGKEPEDMDKEFILYQVVNPNVEKGGNDIYVVDTENELVYFSHENNQVINYFKFDYQKRKGFTDAQGVGANEQVFNVIVQTKTNQKRLDNVLTIVTKAGFQKKIDNERDNLVGKDYTTVKDGKVLGYKENPLEALNLGGDKQVAFLTNELNNLTQKAGSLLNMNDALQGETLPSGTSGVLGNLLSENASSVFKEVQKSYAKFIGNIYDDSVTEYLLSVFDKADALHKHLTPNDIRLVEQSVMDYMTLLKQIDAQILGEEFNEAEARAEVKEEIKDKDIISGDLLKNLREDVKGIDTFISGEKVSKAKTVAFIREMRASYAGNPEAFLSPFNIATLKKEAQYEAGLGELEIDQLLKEISQ